MSSSKSQEVSAHKKQKLVSDSHAADKTQNKHIAEIEIKPRERFPLLLGSFAADNSPIGFSIEMNPDTLVTQVVILKTDEGHRYVSYLTNSGKKTVTAKVYQL